MIESHLRVKKSDKSMESSLSRSLRSLLAAMALLMAAYAIAASPEGAWSARKPATDTVALLAPLAGVQQELGFGSGRQDAVAKAESEGSTAPVSPGLAWAFAGLCLIGALAQRRLMNR